MIVTTARTRSPDRFREVFETIGSVKRTEHGCRSARLYFDPDDAHRAWSIFDWDAEDYQGFLDDPEIPLIARELQLEGPPVHVTAVVELGASAAHRPVRRFSSDVTDAVTDFGNGILIAAGLDAQEGASMSAYTAFLAAGARADLPAPYAEIWVVLTGALRVGAGSEALTVRAGEYVHVPEQAAGTVEAIDDTKIICVSVPAH